jgi:hypothetical protein
MNTCTKCNNQLPQGGKFCRKCGTATNQAKPLQVIALQKKFWLVACLKDLLLPGNGFLYTERMVEGALIGLATIPLTIWAILQYIQLWLADVLANLRLLGSGYPADFSTSDNFKMWLIWLSIVWLVIRWGLLVKFVSDHNRKISQVADISQLAAFVNGK